MPHKGKTEMNNNKRKMLGITGAVALVSSMPGSWTRPVIQSVILPAHAQTSEMIMCMATDTTVGGPLEGNPHSATTCQAACEAEATAQNAGLCAVNETTTATGVDCLCDLDLP